MWLGQVHRHTITQSFHEFTQYFLHTQAIQHTNRIMRTAIAKITAILLVCTNGIAAHSHYVPTTEESATEFSLLDDAGDHVLTFGAANHGRRLDSTKKIHLKFKAFGSSFEYHLHPSPLMMVPETKIFSYNKQAGHFHKFDAPEEARSFTTEARDAGLTFLKHNKITGTVLLHNRYEKFAFQFTWDWFGCRMSVRKSLPKCKMDIIYSDLWKSTAMVSTLFWFLLHTQLSTVVWAKSTSRSPATPSTPTSAIPPKTCTPMASTRPPPTAT